MPLIDTQTLHTGLLKSDMTEPQASAIVKALADADTGQLATKERLEGMKNEIRTEIANLNGEIRTEITNLNGEIGVKIANLRGDIEMLRWMGGTLLTFQVMLFGGLLALLWKVFTAVATVVNTGGS